MSSSLPYSPSRPRKHSPRTPRTHGAKPYVALTPTHSMSPLASAHLPQAARPPTSPVLAA